MKPFLNPPRNVQHHPGGTETAGANRCLDAPTRNTAASVVWPGWVTRTWRASIASSYKASRALRCDFFWALSGFQGLFSSWFLPRENRRQLATFLKTILTISQPWSPIPTVWWVTETETAWLRSRWGADYVFTDSRAFAPFRSRQGAEARLSVVFLFGRGWGFVGSWWVFIWLMGCLVCFGFFLTLLFWLVGFCLWCSLLLVFCILCWLSCFFFLFSGVFFAVFVSFFLFQGCLFTGGQFEPVSSDFNSFLEHQDEWDKTKERWCPAATWGPLLGEYLRVHRPQGVPNAVQLPRVNATWKSTRGTNIWKQDNERRTMTKEQKQTSHQWLESH